MHFLKYFLLKLLFFFFQKSESHKSTEISLLPAKLYCFKWSVLMLAWLREFFSKKQLNTSFLIFTLRLENTMVRLWFFLHSAVYLRRILKFEWLQICPSPIVDSRSKSGFFFQNFPFIAEVPRSHIYKNCNAPTPHRFLLALQQHMHAFVFYITFTCFVLL